MSRTFRSSSSTWVTLPRSANHLHKGLTVSQWLPSPSMCAAGAYVMCRMSKITALSASACWLVPQNALSAYPRHFSILFSADFNGLHAALSVSGDCKRHNFHTKRLSIDLDQAAWQSDKHQQRKEQRKEPRWMGQTIENNTRYKIQDSNITGDQSVQSLQSKQDNLAGRTNMRKPIKHINTLKRHGLRNLRKCAECSPSKSGR